MKKSVRVLALILVCAMMLCMAACNEKPAGTNPSTTSPSTAPSTNASSTPSTAPTQPQLTLEEKVMAFMAEMENAKAPGLNAFESSWEDMVAHLTEKGVISADAAQVDMLATAGYLKKYDGTFEDTYAFADKAIDFGGVYLIWWNLAEPTAAYDCYSSMQMNGGTIVVMGGMYTVNATPVASGSFALAFAEGYDEAAKTAALDVFNAIDATAYSLKYMSGTTDLAMAMMNAGLLAATDIAGAVNMNAQYVYTCMRQDWVGYEQSPETGYGDPYETTDYAVVATQAYTFGNVSILYFAAADVAETSWYPHMVSIFNQIMDSSTLTPYCRPNTDWTYAPYTVDAEGNYSAEGTNLEIAVDGLFGRFAIIVNE